MCVCFDVQFLQLGKGPDGHRKLLEIVVVQVPGDNGEGQSRKKEREGKIERQRY